LNTWSTIADVEHDDSRAGPRNAPLHKSISDTRHDLDGLDVWIGSNSPAISRD